MNDPAHAAGRFPLGQQVQQREQLLEIAPGEDLFDRFLADGCLGQFVADRPAERKAELEREPLRDLKKITVERAHAKAMQLAGSAGEQFRRPGRREAGVADRLGECTASFGVGGCLREPEQDAILNLAGCLAGERGGQNLIGGHAGGQQPQVAAGELIRFAGAGARTNYEVRRRCGLAHGVPPGSPSRHDPRR